MAGTVVRTLTVVIFTERLIVFYVFVSMSFFTLLILLPCHAAMLVGYWES